MCSTWSRTSVPAGRGAARRLSRPRVLLPAAAALAAVAVALVLALGGGEGTPAGYEIALRPVAGATAAGRAQLASADGGTTLHLWVPRAAARPRASSTRSSATRRAGAPAPGTFRADAHGRAYVVLTTAARRGEYDAIRVVRRTRASSTDVLEAKL